MKIIIQITLSILCTYSFYISCSYPPIKNAVLCNKLNTIRHSIASNNTSNETIIENVENFIQEYGEYSISLPNTKGNTLLSEAAFRNRFLVVKFLLENGAEPNPIDMNGNTPLHRACRENKRKHKFFEYKEFTFKIIKLLIEKTQDFSLKNIRGKTIIDHINNNSFFSSNEKETLLNQISMYQNKKNLLNNENNIQTIPEENIISQHQFSLYTVCKNANYATIKNLILSLDYCDPHKRNDNNETPLNLIPINNNLSFYEKIRIIELLYLKDSSGENLTLYSFLPPTDGIENTFNLEINW